MSGSDPSARCDSCLFVVATPIGNLDDLSPRAARILRSVDVVAAEDTRRTRKILARVGSSARVVSVREANEGRMSHRIVEDLRAGQSVALATDAGTPGVGDPGARLVEAAHAAGVRVVPVPGPSAVTAALSASGVRADRFVFEGYLPGRTSRRRRRLETLRGEDRPVVLFVPPHDLRKVLAEAADILGADRPACLGREMTKVHEEVVRSTLGALAAEADRYARGEVVLVIGPAG